MATAEKVGWALLILTSFVLYTLHPVYADSCTASSKTEEERDDFPVEVTCVLNANGTVTVSFYSLKVYAGKARGRGAWKHFERGKNGKASVTVRVNKANPQVEIIIIVDGEEYRKTITAEK